MSAEEIEIVPPCKCEQPFCGILAHTILNKVRRKKISKRYWVFKMRLYFDCIFHGRQELQITVCQDYDWANVGDWHMYSPANVVGYGRNCVLTPKKSKKKKPDK